MVSLRRINPTAVHGGQESKQGWVTVKEQMLLTHTRDTVTQKNSDE